jgi:8-oxo-dGTP diphosphatase
VRQDPNQNLRPSVTVDTIVLALGERGLEVLLVQRRYPPFQDMWAIPGGFVEIDESLDAAARRELAEETGISDLQATVEQLRAFGAPERDPRTRVVTVAYTALVRARDIALRAGSDAAQAAWFSVDALPELAFDHETILSCALLRLRHQVRYSPAIFGLLPDTFTLTELQNAFEQTLGCEIDKRNFRRKMLATGALEDTRDLRAGNHRPARLYRYRQEAAPHLQARPLFP